jgi:hypothetical protein
MLTEMQSLRKAGPSVVTHGYTMCCEHDSGLGALVANYITSSILVSSQQNNRNVLFTPKEVSP